MTVTALPSAADLVSYVVAFSASYQALAQEHGALDPRFREPADGLLDAVSRSFTFQNPHIERPPGNVVRVLNRFEIARFVTERAPHYARETNHWKTLLDRDPEFQTELWRFIEAAADGFVQAGYDVYAPPEAPGSWASAVLERRAVPEPFPPDLAHLSLPVRRLGKNLADKDYDRAAREILFIRRQSSGAASRRSGYYFDVLINAYLSTPFGSRIRRLMAEELEASEKPKALRHLSFEAETVVALWAMLPAWGKLRRIGLLWTALESGLRFRRMSRRFPAP